MKFQKSTVVSEVNLVSQDVELL